MLLRPEISKYGELYNDVHHFSTTLADHDKISSLMHDLGTSSPRQLAVTQENFWQDKSAYFLKSFGNKFAKYEDTVVPLSMAVHQIKFGLRVMASAISTSERSHLKVMDCSLCVNTLQHLLDDITCFPKASDSLSTTIQSILGPTTVMELQSMVGMPHTKTAYSLFLKLSLHYASVYSLNSGHLDSSVLQVLHSVFRSFTEVMTSMEKEEKERQAKEQDLYKVKTRSHKMETSEEKENKELKEMFPDFLHHFEDLTLETDQASVNGKDPHSEVTSSAGLTTDTELFQLYRMHQFLFNTLTPHTIVKCDQKMLDRERLEIVRLVHNVAATLLQGSIALLY